MDNKMTTSHSTENPQIDPMPTKNGDRMEVEWSKKLTGRKHIANEKEARCGRRLKSGNKRLKQ